MLNKLKLYLQKRAARIRFNRKCRNLRSILTYMQSQRDFYTAEANKYGDYKDHVKAVEIGKEIQRIIDFLVDSYN